MAHGKSMLGHSLVFVGFVALGILRIASEVRGVRGVSNHLAELDIFLERIKVLLLGFLKRVSHNALGLDGDGFDKEVSLLRFVGILGSHIVCDEKLVCTVFIKVQALSL